MQLPFFPRSVEERVDQEEQNLSELSVETLRYMYEYGVAWEEWLRHHHGNLLFLAESEHDLLEAMSLSARLKNVERNIRTTGRRIERISSQMLARDLAR